MTGHGRLETASPVTTAMVRRALIADVGDALLTEVLPLLALEDHIRNTCPCDTCKLFRRVRRHLGRS